MINQINFLQAVGVVYVRRNRGGHTLVVRLTFALFKDGYCILALDTVSFLAFKRQCAIYLLISCRSFRLTSEIRTSLSFSPALEEIRKDGTGHIVEKVTSKYGQCQMGRCLTTYFNVLFNEIFIQSSIAHRIFDKPARKR